MGIYFLSPPRVFVLFSLAIGFVSICAQKEIKKKKKKKVDGTVPGQIHRPFNVGSVHIGLYNSVAITLG